MKEGSHKPKKYKLFRLKKEKYFRKDKMRRRDKEWKGEILHKILWVANLSITKDWFKENKMNKLINHYSIIRCSFLKNKNSLLAD